MKLPATIQDDRGRIRFANASHPPDQSSSMIVSRTTSSMVVTPS